MVTSYSRKLEHLFGTVLGRGLFEKTKKTRGDDLTFEKTTNKLTYHSKQDFEKRYKINEQGFTFEKTNNYTVIIDLNK